MTTFYDDFERDNGGLGANWPTNWVAPNISGGYVTTGISGGGAYNTDASSTGRHEVTITAGFVNSGSGGAVAMVKVAAAGSTCYGCWISYSAPDYTLNLGKGTHGTQTVIDSAVIGSSLPFMWTVHLVWENGHLTGEACGQTVEADDIEYAGNNYCGLYSLGNAVRIADYRGIAGDPTALEITPSVVGNYGTTITLTATGTNTAWTSGTPGSPTFTCNHGTITAQEVLSATSATLTFDPGNYLGAVTFTDPTTGVSDTIIVTSDTTIVPPNGNFLSQEAIDYIERSAIAETNPTIANREMNIATSGPSITLSNGIGTIRLATVDKTYSVGGEPAVAQIADILWQLVNGSVDPEVGVWQHASGVPLSEQLGDILTRWNELITVNEYTLGTVITTLAGEGVHTHKSIMDAIAAIEGGSNQDVLDAIAAMQGDPLATLKAILDYLFVMRTVNEWTLGDVKSWVEAVRGTDQPTIANVMTKLFQIQPSPTISLATIANSIIIESQMQTMLQLVTAAITGVGGSTILDVLTQIGLLSDKVDGIAAPVGPLWPGLANVTLGEELTLSNGLQIDGPMSGLLFTVTAHPTHYQSFPFGDVTSYARVGMVIFQTDRGDWERSQTFGLDAQILNPQTMEVATSAIVDLNPGWAGTVRTWTRNA